MAGTKWSAKEKEAVVEIVTSWEQRGIEKGLAQGIERGLAQGIERGLAQGIERGIEIGRQAGQVEALRAALIDFLGWRFGDLNESLTVRLAAIDSVERLRALTHRALTAGSIQELGF
jgi:flagellar biosynthesis/type III secretory pathway protein FliH